MLFAADKVWHFWIAVPLALMAIVAVAAIAGLYVTKVTRTRYPKSES
jgi:hypothetical protein